MMYNVKQLSIDLLDKPILLNDVVAVIKDNSLNLYKIIGETGKNKSMLQCYPIIKIDNDYYTKIRMKSIKKDDDIIKIIINNVDPPIKFDQFNDCCIDSENMPRAK